MDLSLLARTLTLTLAVSGLHAVQTAALQTPAPEVRESEQAAPVPAPAWALTTDERTELAAHQAAAHDLEAQRGGQLTQREWTWILIGAVAVLLLVIIV